MMRPLFLDLGADHPIWIFSSTSFYLIHILLALLHMQKDNDVITQLIMGEVRNDTPFH